MADQPAKKQKTDVETLGISEMKALIKSAGLSSADCVEKSDLRARCREAQERLAEAERLRTAAAPAPSQGRPKFVDFPAHAGMDMAEYICQTGDGMDVNLLDRPAEQIAGLWDDEVRDAGLVNTIRRGLREFGLSV